MKLLHASGLRDRTIRKLYESWVHDFSRELFAFAYRLSGDVYIAEDLVQETFYEAWRSLDNLRDPQKSRAWLFQILRHRYAHWRRDSGRRILLDATFDQLDNTLSNSGLDILESLELRETLQDALDRLDDRYRESFLLVFVEGLTCQETAEQLQIPLGTVLSRIHRARKKLRDLLGPVGGKNVKWKPDVTPVKKGNGR